MGRLTMLAPLLGVFVLSAVEVHASRCTVPPPGALRLEGPAPGTNLLTVIWDYRGHDDCKDYYNVRWTLLDGPSNQVEAGGGTCFVQWDPFRLCRHQIPIAPDNPYRIEVQACNRRALQASDCSVWAKTVYRPYGEKTCKVGFVWREAVPDDRVCVTPQTRDRARTDNGLAASRRQPGGGPWGPDTCRSGLVWREATPTDHVCVPPQTRDQTRRDNDAAHTRVAR